jgi:hypothetical protein
MFILLFYRAGAGPQNDAAPRSSLLTVITGIYLKNLIYRNNALFIYRSFAVDFFD